MAGRRRTRLLIAIALFVVATLVYTRRQSIEPVADYVKDSVVGGGAVLRGNKAGAQQPAALPTTSQARLTREAATAEPARSTTQQAVEPAAQTSIVRAVATSASAAQTEPPVLPDRVPQHKLPPVPDEEDLPVQEGEGRKEHSQIMATSSMIHWTRQSEHFPVSTTIQLPTGSSKPFPRIQYNGKMEADKERLAVIKAAIVHAWNGYRDAAFAEDEVMPISGGFKNPFNGWGATMVDSLDTLWIMNMKAEFDEAVEAVREIDFTTSIRSDIPLFETVIRYLGGLVAAYDISNAKYPILLDKAVELAEVLFGAFDSPNRMPQTYYRWKPAFASQPHRASNRVVLAELGSLNSEFTRLAQLTGEPKYYDAIARITDALDEWQNSTRLPGMWPTLVDASGCHKPAQMNPMQNFIEKMVPDGSGGFMASGPPVAGGGSEKVLAPDAGAVAREKKGNPEQELSEAVASRQPGTGKIIGFDQPFEEGSLDGKSKKQVLSGPGSSKVKRQPDTKANVIDANTEQINSTLHKEELRAATETVKAGPAKDTRTGQDVCIEQGLGSTSKHGQEFYTLGGQSDSTYEYLPKQYMLLGGLAEQYKDMYLYSAQSEIDELVFRPMTPDNRDILMSGKLRVSINATDESLIKTFDPEYAHLTCFAGGMFALGGRLFNNSEHVEIGWKLTDGCVWAYNSTASGIMPEEFTVVKCDDVKECQWNQTEYWRQLDPYEKARTKLPSFKATTAALPQLPDVTRTAAATATPSSTTANAEEATKTLEVKLAEEERMVKRQLAEAALDEPKAAVAASTSSTTSVAPSTTRPIWTPPTPLPHEEFVQKKIEDERLPPGMVRLVSRKYILRPEAIESVFYMYRITGDQYWRDVGWDMFTAIDRHTRALYGNSAIDDVTKSAPEAKDTMESFWIAETLKYFWLLYDDPTTWSLDDWVLNTEAHFFRRPKYDFA